MRVHLSQRSHMETYKEMVDAIQLSGGVPGVDVTLSSSLQNQKPSPNMKMAGVKDIEQRTGYRTKNSLLLIRSIVNFFNLRA